MIKHRRKNENEHFSNKIVKKIHKLDEIPKNQIAKLLEPYVPISNNKSQISERTNIMFSAKASLCKASTRSSLTSKKILWCKS